jgi:hypothetical protein
MACSHKASCNYVHWNGDTLNTHALTIFGYFLEVSLIHSSIIWEVLKSVRWDSNLENIQPIEGVEMVVMPTILAWSCSCAWDHYHVERPTYLDPNYNFFIVDHKKFSKINLYKRLDPSYLQLCTMLPTQKPSRIPKSSPTHYHALRPDAHFEVQRVLYLQSNTMTYHLS